MPDEPVSSGWREVWSKEIASIPNVDNSNVWEIPEQVRNITVFSESIDLWVSGEDNVLTQADGNTRGSRRLIMAGQYYSFEYLGGDSRKVYYTNRVPTESAGLIYLEGSK